MSRINVSSKLEVIEKKLDELKFLSLSLTGKVRLINSVIHSQLFYLNGVYLPPKKELDEIRALRFQFIWDGKREVIERKTMETSKEHGGLGLNNLT